MSSLKANLQLNKLGIKYCISNTEILFYNLHKKKAINDFKWVTVHFWLFLFHCILGYQQKSDFLHLIGLQSDMHTNQIWTDSLNKAIVSHLRWCMQYDWWSTIIITTTCRFYKMHFLKSLPINHVWLKLKWLS